MVDNVDGALRPGLCTEVRSGRQVHREAIVVPPGAVGGQGDSSFAYVIRDEMVERRPVRVRRLTAERVEVLEGLEEGERYVASSLGRVTEGSRVAERSDTVAAVPSTREESVQ